MHSGKAEIHNSKRRLKLQKRCDRSTCTSILQIDTRREPTKAFVPTDQWQGLFEHGHLLAGQSVLVHGAAGVVGSMATQLARAAGAYVIGTGRAAARQTALDFGAQKFVDLDNEDLEDVGKVDLVFDVIGGDIAKRSAGVIRAGGTLVTITGQTEARPTGGLTIDFVVVPDRAQLSELVLRVRDGRLRTNIGKMTTLDDAVAAFNRTERIKG